LSQEIDSIFYFSLASGSIYVVKKYPADLSTSLLPFAFILEDGVGEHD